MPINIDVFHIAYEVETLTAPTQIERTMRAKGYTGEPRPGDPAIAPHIFTASDVYFRMLTEHLRDIFVTQMTDSLARADAQALVFFTAPEFYYKDVGGVPFSNGVFQRGIEYLNQLFRDAIRGLGARCTIVCLPGTIWWSQPSAEDPKHLAIVHNTGPAILSSDLSQSFYWDKQNLSRIDGLKEGSEQWDKASEEMKPIYANMPGGLPVHRLLVGGGHVHFGVEICRDYLLGNLRKLIGSETSIDVHVILACGASLDLAEKVSYLVARTDGVVLRCDGHRLYTDQDPASFQRKSESRLRLAGTTFATGLTASHTPQYKPSWASGVAQVHDRVACYPARRIICPT